jgi:hypothetical protein
MSRFETQQGADRRAVQPYDQVSFPMPGHGPGRGLGGLLGDHDLGCDELLAAAAGARPGDGKRPAGAQARDELALEHPAALDIQSLVDRLVRDPHGLIIGEVGPQPGRDLLRAPGPGPATVRAPAHRRAWRSPRPGDPARTHAARGSRRACPPWDGERAVSACHWAVVARYAAEWLRVDALRRSSREIVDGARPTRRAISRTPSCCAQDRDLLALSERQVPPRQRGQRDWRHPASLTEPPRPDRLRHASHGRRVLARRAAGDRLPEPDPVLAPPSRRPAWRPYLAAHRTNRLLKLPGTHIATPPDPGVATTG